jgi:predicted Zn finger-like uncharacterized protein
MILTCPNCGTQYVVKDGAIPTEGRQVRCAACKHSWHQDPEASAPDESEAQPVAQEGADSSITEQEPPGSRVSEEPPIEADESLAEATLIDPRSGPEAEERAYEEAVIEGDAEVPAADEAVARPTEAEAPDAEAAGREPVAADWREPPTAEPEVDTFSPFLPGDETEQRRRSPAVTILVLAILVIIVAAAFWFFAPAALKAKLGLAAAGTTPLQIVTTHMDRQHLQSGNDLLTLTGRVINPSGREQTVPPIQAELKNHSGQVVYSWTIQPPAPSLAAGASASFNSAEVSVPPGGEELTITLGGAAGRNG